MGWHAGYPGFNHCCGNGEIIHVHDVIKKSRGLNFPLAHPTAARCTFISDNLRCTEVSVFSNTCFSRETGSDCIVLPTKEKGSRQTTKRIHTIELLGSVELSLRL